MGGISFKYSIRDVGICGTLPPSFPAIADSVSFPGFRRRHIPASIRQSISGDDFQRSFPR